MSIKTFQDLVVWQKGHSLVLEIYKITKDYPDEERFGLVVQVRRSAVSICANIVEGYKKSTKDFLRYLDISEGSLEETKYHLLLSKDLEYCSYETYDKLNRLAGEIGWMIYRLKQSLRK